MKSRYPTLRKEAIKYQKRAYSPYSTVKVGAAVEAGGEVFGGCNIENMSYGGTMCAERVAIFKAVSEGHKKISKLYLYTKELWTPCGLCLQVMSEFMKPDDIVIAGSQTQEKVYKFKDLMPSPLSEEAFNKNKY